MRCLRTPEDRFADLPGFDYPPRYADIGGMRLAWVEAGPPGGEPVLLLHGEPSWSFLYRTVLAGLADAGLRAIAVDLAGFGRSDKPASIAQRLLDLGKPPGTAVACIERAATAQQQVTRCTLRELALPGSSPAIANPAVIVIGPTVSLLPSDG